MIRTLRSIQLPIAVAVGFFLAISCKDQYNVPGETPFARVSISEKTVPSKAGDFYLSINSNTSWTLECSADWLSVTPASGEGKKSVKVSYSVSTVQKRTATIRLKAQDIRPVDVIVTQSDKTFTNPVTAGSSPDPWVVKYGNSYYFCKSGSGGVAISKSDKLTVINATKGVWQTPIAATGAWNSDNLWAPELHYIKGKWYVYYAAGRPKSETGDFSTQRSGVLRAVTSDPLGAWEDMGMLYTGDNYKEGVKATRDNCEFAIDLHPFELNGKMYCVWSGERKDERGQQLYIASMSNPYTISSSRVMLARADQGWELVSSKLLEGPAVLKNKEKGKFYIVYSCNGSWTKDYRLGYLELRDTLANPLDRTNWVKSQKEAFYRCDNTSSVDGVNGVGHNCFTKSPDETEDWIVYHVKQRNDDTWESGRPAFMQKITWKADGSPDFGKPVGWGEQIIVPSGEQ